jgi:hypothetical protein
MKFSRGTRGEKRMDRESAKVWSETFKNIAQIIAIILAGIWTYYTFIRKESPALEARADATSTLHWNAVGGTGECEAQFRVDIDNNGAAAFDISKIQVQGWIFDKIKEPGKIATYLDLAQIQKKGNLIFDTTYSYDPKPRGSEVSAPFVGHYPPGKKFGHSFEWVFDQANNKWAFFRADFFVNGEERNAKWHTGAWGRVCGDGGVK